MGDEDKTLDAVEEPSPVEADKAPDSDVTIDAEAAEAEAPKLRLADRDEEGGEEALGAAAVGSDELLGNGDGLGAPEPAPRKKGLAALFGGAKAADEGDAEEDTPRWAMAGARPRRQGGGIRVVNRVLAVAVILILVFGVLDLFATIRQAPGGFAVLDEPTPAGDPVVSDGGGSDGLPALANLLESFSARPIVRNLDRGGGETTVQVVQTRQKVPDWKVEAQKLDLIGLSGAPNGEMEAIVADREAGRMHILRVGQDMTVGENTFRLARIATDHVAFAKDGDEVIVK